MFTPITHVNSRLLYPFHSLSFSIPPRLYVICHSHTKSFWSWSVNPPVSIQLPTLDFCSQPKHKLKCGADYYDPLAYLRTNAIELDKYIAQEQRSSDQYFRSSHRWALKRTRSKLHTYLKVRKVIPPIPEESNGFAYWTESTVRGPAYWRKSLMNPNSKPELVLDPQSLPRGHTITKITLSPSHTYIGYLVECSGNEFGSLYVKQITRSALHNGPRILDLPIMGFEFISDFVVAYTICDTKLQPTTVYFGDWRHPSSQHQQVWQCTSSFIDLGKTKDSKYLTINASTLTSSEVRVVPVNDPKSYPILIHPREEGHQYFVDHHNDQFFILTTCDGAVNGKLVVAPSLYPTRPYWKDLVVPNKGDKIEDVDIFATALVLYMRRLAESVVVVYPLQPSSSSSTASMKPYEIPVPKGTSVLPGSNKDYGASTIRLMFQHPFHFDITRVWDMHLQQFSSTETQSVPNFDEHEFDISRIWVTSSDTFSQIPVTLLHRRGLVLDSSHPVLLRAYGAYGVCLNTHLRMDSIELLKRGWIVALAHVRGGSELGWQWHMDGRLEHKMNSFNDLINVAEHLIKAGYTSSSKLIASGHSAGGMTVGAAALLRPELFSGIVLHAPFVDVLGSMLDPTLPLTEGEYVEWGNPSTSKSIFELQMQYSPYEQVLRYLASKGTSTNTSRWPDMYVTCGKLDQRTPAWQVAKFVAGYRHILATLQIENTPEVILEIDEEGTHFGNASDGYSAGQLDMMAREIVFVENVIQRNRQRVV